MKKNAFYNLTILALIMVSFAVSSDLLAQTKTITYDWTTKQIVGNKTLPFDQPFSIIIEHLDPNINHVQLLIKEGNPKECKSPLDTVCFKELYTVSELSFTQKNLQSTIMKENLKPNRDYYLGFIVKERIKLSADSSKNLNKYLRSSKKFNTEINGALHATRVSELKVSTFNRIYYDNVQFYNKSYEVDTAAITSDESGSAQYNIRQSARKQISLGSKIADFANELHTSFNIERKQFEMLMAPVIESQDSCCYLKVDFDMEAFLGDVEKVKIAMMKATPADSGKIKSLFLEQVEVFKGQLESGDTAIGNWFQQSIMQTTINKTYISITLGTTTIDQQSTTASPYISQSFGYGFSPRTAKGAFYFSYSIFFRPINLSVPLSYYKTGWDYFATRFCANIGFTLDDAQTNKRGKITGLGSIFGNKAGLFGIGYRPLPFLKVDINYMMYYMNDPNPLLNQKRFIASPVFGLSFNLNIIKLFSGQPNSLSSLQNFIK